MGSGRYIDVGESSSLSPVSREEIVAVLDELHHAYVELVDDTDKSDVIHADLLTIMVAALYREVLALYNAVSMVRRTKESEAFSSGYSALPLFQAVASGTSPAPLIDLSLLRRGPPKPNKWLAPLRAIKNLRRSGGISHPSPASVDWQNDIVVITINSLIEQHAAQVAEDVKYVRSCVWFDGLKPESVVKEIGVLSKGSGSLARQGVLEAVEKAFSAGGETLPDFLARHVEELFSTLWGIYSCHYKQVLAQPERVPKRLWAGNSGPRWHGMLRHATFRLDGEVVGHDHGIGGAFLKSNHKHLGDYIACSRYYTYTENCVTGLEESMESQIHFRDQKPKIVTIKQDIERTGDSKGSRQRATAPRVRTDRRDIAMYLAPGFDGGSARPLPKPTWEAQADWQQRLFNKLNNWNIDIIYKYHPEYHESEEALKSRYTTARILGGRMEKYLQEANLIITDWPMTSAFRSAIMSDLPVIFIDLGLADFRDDAMQMLKRRCAVVEGTFDQNGRYSVEWDHLQTAIAEAPAKSSSEFSDCFFQC